MQNFLTRRLFLSLIAASAVMFGATTAMAADPEETGKQVYQVYVDTMAQTNAALAGSPEVTAELGAEIDAIKEAGVTKLVALGKEIAAMSEADRETVERIVRLGAYEPEAKAVYANYQGVWKAYVGGDQDFFKKIQSLNILTQYAFFDLLRKQAPDEADRLGV
ncbi:hypothetical protein [Vannielia sp.]|uniref:hypothetical protein n=1 Tax=Vannielia sp. TaxID=2813045 RepID=UPI00263487F9|nr:hypothetical protein [Vannielia sp.]